MELTSFAPSKYLNSPPFVAKQFSEKTGWAGVLNRDGVNCLTVPSRPGVVIADMRTCMELAQMWNLKGRV
jgi:hypothetical protein